MGVSGSTGTTAGRSNGTSGSSSSSSGNSSGGKQATGGHAAEGGDAPIGPVEGGADAGGQPGKPHEPPKPPHEAGGAGGVELDCPATPPADKAECTDMGKCDYPDLECRCEGPEDARKWKCKQPPKPPENMCPPAAPRDDASCKAAELPATACHYEDPKVDCTCTADKWVCADAT